MKPFVSTVINANSLPEFEYRGVIGFPTNEACYLLPEYQSNNSLFNENLLGTWGVINKSKSHRIKVSDKHFNTPEEAIQYAESELLRVFPKTKEQESNLIKFIDL